MTADHPIGVPVDSDEAWAKLMSWLPEMLDELLASEVFDADRRPPTAQHGIYLFSEGGAHLYVGRTGITARSRAKGGTPVTSFRHRFDQHIQPGRPPGASSFANRLLLERATAVGLAVPDDWWESRNGATSAVYDVYKAAKARIGAMDCRVVAFNDDIKGVRSTLAEVFVHVQLGTPYNDFLTS